jgi:hypothetical protein
VSRVSVALTTGRNISPTLSNFGADPGAHGSQWKAGFIEVSWDQGCDALVWFAARWQVLWGSSSCLPAKHVASFARSRGARLLRSVTSRRLLAPRAQRLLRASSSGSQ